MLLPALANRLILAGGVAVAAIAILAGMDLKERSRTLTIARTMTNGDPVRAPNLLRRYGCGGCHTIRGIARADGKVAAPLQDLRERVYIAGVVPNTSDNLVKWIINPQALSPRSAMPATGISESEARDVAAYLYGR